MTVSARRTAAHPARDPGQGAFRLTRMLDVRQCSPSGGSAGAGAAETGSLDDCEGAPPWQVTLLLSRGRG